MNKLSGSSIERFLRCAWPERPDVSFTDVRLKDSGREVGNATHEALAAEEESADAEVAARVRHIEKKIAELGATEVVREIALAYDPQTKQARKLGENIHREYEKHGMLPHEIPCSLDVVVFGNENVVIDVKTGQQDYVEDVENNAQLSFGALCVERAFGVKVHRVALWFSRLDRVWEESWPVDPWMLPAFEQKLLAQLKVEKPLPTTGDHCRFCPALGGCPATMRQLAQVAPGDFEWSTDVKNLDHAAWMAENISILDKACERVRGALQAFADGAGGIAMANGKVWRAVEARRESMNTAAVKTFLGDRYPEFVSLKTFKTYRAVKA